MNGTISFISKIRPILEAFSFLSSIGLFTTIIIGLYQIKLLKKDMGDRNKRAAVEKSIEYLNWFATDFIPSFDEFLIKSRRDQVVFQKGPFNDFLFTHECNLYVAEVKVSLEKFYEHNGLSLANQLEFFAAALRSGLADEELVFNPIAQLYCGNVEALYVGYCNSRKDSDSISFTHTIELYKMWRQRLDKSEKDNENKKQSLLPFNGDKRIKSIGS